MAGKPPAKASAGGATPTTTPAPASRPELRECVVHPLVLLNCVDHYSRVSVGSSKRVVGVLLGTRNHATGVVDITK